MGTDGYLYYLSHNDAALYKIIYIGTDCQTVQNGSWHDAATWSCGHVPISTDKAIVGHAITINTGMVSSALTIQYTGGGKIVFNPNGKLQVGL